MNLPADQLGIISIKSVTRTLAIVSANSVLTSAVELATLEALIDPGTGTMTLDRLMPVAALSAKRSSRSPTPR